MSPTDRVPEKNRPKTGKGNATSFKPGQSGNPKGRPKGTGSHQRLAAILAEFLAEEDNFEVKGANKTERMGRERAFIRKMFSLAMAGQGWAARLIWNYRDGLPYFSGKIVIPRDDDEESGLDAETEEAVDKELTRLIMGGEQQSGDGG